MLGWEKVEAVRSEEPGSYPVLGPFLNLYDVGTIALIRATVKSHQRRTFGKL